MRRFLIIVGILLCVALPGRAQTVSFVQEDDTGGLNSTLLNGIAAGDLLYGVTCWSGLATALTSFSDGTSYFALSTRIGTDGFGDYCQGAWLLSANAGGHYFTAVPNNTTTAEQVFVFEFNTTSGSWSYDSDNSNAAMSANLTTGNVVTTSTHEVVVFAGKLSNVGASYSGATINGNTATTANGNESYFPAFYQLPGATFTGQGALTWSGTTYWGASIGAFNLGTPAPSCTQSIALLGVGCR